MDSVHPTTFRLAPHQNAIAAKSVPEEVMASNGSRCEERAVAAMDAMQGDIALLAGACTDSIDIEVRVKGLENLCLVENDVLARRLATELATRLRHDPATRETIEREIGHALNLDIADQSRLAPVTVSGHSVRIDMAITDNIRIEATAVITHAAPPFDHNDVNDVLDAISDDIDEGGEALTDAIERERRVQVPALRIAGREALEERIQRDWIERGSNNDDVAAAEHDTLRTWCAQSIEAELRIRVEEVLGLRTMSTAAQDRAQAR